jgi:hypothetical protein
MRKQIYVALAASLLAACGENGLMNSPAAPSQVAAPQASADEKLSGRFVQGPNSCPDGELVSGITVNTNATTQAYISWNDVATIREYIVRITRYQSGDVVLQHSVKNRTVDKVSLSGSTYVVYIGYQNDCGGFGPFGRGVVFSLDSPDNTPPAPAIDNGGDDDPPPPPPVNGDQPSDTDEGGPQGGNEGGPQGGNPCHLNPTSNGHGNDHGNDHNGDGHPDCGHGNDNGHHNDDDDHHSDGHNGHDH